MHSLPAEPPLPLVAGLDERSSRRSRLLADPTDGHYRRPRILGNPLDLASDPYLPKPLTLIEMKEAQGRLGLKERRLYNLLLALSWDRLADPCDHGIFAARAADLRRACGLAARDNRGLRESLERLVETEVVFEQLVAGDINDGRAPLLAGMSLPRGNETVEWEFPTNLRPYIAAPARWAKISLRASASFCSGYALALYERLSLLWGLDHPRWSVNISELREALGAVDALGGWHAFYRRVIGPGLDEIERAAPFRAFCEPVRESGSRRVVRLIFGVEPRARRSGPLLRPCRIVPPRPPWKAG